MTCRLWRRKGTRSQAVCFCSGCRRCVGLGFRTVVPYRICGLNKVPLPFCTNIWHSRCSSRSSSIRWLSENTSKTYPDRSYIHRCCPYVHKRQPDTRLRHCPWVFCCQWLRVLKCITELLGFIFSYSGFDIRAVWFSGRSGTVSLFIRIFSVVWSKKRRIGWTALITNPGIVGMCHFMGRFCLFTAGVWLFFI